MLPFGFLPEFPRSLRAAFGGCSPHAPEGAVSRPPTGATLSPGEGMGRCASDFQGEGAFPRYFGIVIVSTISASVSLRSETAPIPAAWIRERDWVRLLRNPPRLTREGGFFS